MQQYEVELESKTKQISQMQTESAQLTQENSELSQQLYVLKTKVTGKEGAITSDEDRIEKIQKDQMVQLLKRNHDTLMQKYELFRQRNEALEKMAVEKEALYNEMKLDADKTGQELFRVQKSFEETRNQKEIFDWVNQVVATFLTYELSPIITILTVRSEADSTPSWPRSTKPISKDLEVAIASQYRYASLASL